MKMVSIISQHTSQWTLPYSCSMFKGSLLEMTHKIWLPGLTTAKKHWTPHWKYSRTMNKHPSSKENNTFAYSLKPPFFKVEFHKKIQGLLEKVNVQLVMTKNIVRSLETLKIILDLPIFLQRSSPLLCMMIGEQMKGLAVDMFCASRPFTLWGRRLTGRLSSFTDLFCASRRRHNNYMSQTHFPQADYGM